MSEHKQSAKLNLLILRFNNIDRASQLYAALGLTFRKEQHGKGPEHYSYKMDGMVFEIYPRRDADESASVRIGFSVANVDVAISNWIEAGGEVVTPAHNSLFLGGGDGPLLPIAMGIVLNYLN